MKALKILTASVLIISVIMLPGCLNYEELNDLTLLSSLGIDKNEDGFIVTAEIVISVLQKENPDQITKCNTETGESMTEALHKIRSYFLTPIYVQHIDLVVISREIAENYMDEFKDFCTLLAPYYDFQVAVTLDQSPEKILETKIFSGKVSGIDLADMITVNNVFEIPPEMPYYKLLSGNGDYILPVITIMPLSTANDSEGEIKNGSVSGTSSSGTASGTSSAGNGNSGSSSGPESGGQTSSAAPEANGSSSSASSDSSGSSGSSNSSDGGGSESSGGSSGGSGGQSEEVLLPKGGALFRDNKLICYVEPYDCGLFLLMSKKDAESYIIFEDESMVSYLISSKPKIKVKAEKDILTADIEVKMVIDSISTKVTKEYVADFLKERAEKFIEFLYKEKQADCLNLYKYFHAFYPREFEDRETFLSRMDQLSFNVSFKVEEVANKNVLVNGF